RNMRIEYVNRSLCHLLGYEPAQLLGQPVGTRWQDPALLEDLHQSMAVGVVWRREVTLRRRDGSLVDTAFTVSPLHRSGDEAQHWVAIVRDISQEKQMRARQIRFFTHAAHELRHPIASLK